MIFQKINQAMKPYWPIIYHHHFNQLLSDGTLPMPIFCHFLKADKAYLFKFAQCLKHVAKRVPDSKHREILLYLSHEAFKTHEKLHDKYLMMDPYLIKFFPKNHIQNPGHEAVNNYMQHLHQTTHSESIPVPIAIASLIPCFYVYSNLGMIMKKKETSSRNPYQLWIDSYSSPTFLLSTQLIFSVLEELMHPELKTQYSSLVIDAFLTSVLYEISFWDSSLANQTMLSQIPSFVRPNWKA